MKLSDYAMATPIVEEIKKREVELALIEGLSKQSSRAKVFKMNLQCATSNGSQLGYVNIEVSESLFSKVLVILDEYVKNDIRNINDKLEQI